MSEFDEAVEACKVQMDKCGIDCDENLLSAIAKGSGPSLYIKIQTSLRREIKPSWMA